MKTNLEFLNAIKAGKSIQLPFDSVAIFFEYLKIMEFIEVLTVLVLTNGVTIRKQMI